MNKLTTVQKAFDLQDLGRERLQQQRQYQPVGIYIYIYIYNIHIQGEESDKWLEIACELTFKKARPLCDSTIYCLGQPKAVI